MKTVRQKAGFNKLKATYALLAVAVVLALGSYGWHLYTLYQAWQRDTPQPQVERRADHHHVVALLQQPIDNV